jgi:hypothetical protein
MYVTVPTAPNVVVKLFFILCNGNQRTYRTKDKSMLTASIHDNKRSKDRRGHCNVWDGYGLFAIGAMTPRAEPQRQGRAVVEPFSV